MSRFLLDTNIVSAVINDRGRHRIRARIAQAGVHRVCTSIIVAAEIRYGIAKKPSARLIASAEEFLGTIDVLALEHPADVHYAALRVDLERRGVPIGSHDMLIAAHCLATGMILVTNNVREFERVQGLTIEDWLTA